MGQHTIRFTALQHGQIPAVKHCNFSHIFLHNFTIVLNSKIPIFILVIPVVNVMGTLVDDATGVLGSPLIMPSRHLMIYPRHDNYLLSMEFIRVIPA